MAYQLTTLLKTVPAQISQNTNVGTGGLSVLQPTNIFLPAGTLLESGNVRIPFDVVDNTDDNKIILEKIDNKNDSAGAGAAAGVANAICNNQNIVYFTDSNNTIYSTLPSDIHELPMGNANEVCYCKIPTNTELQLNNSYLNLQKNIKITLSEDVWLSLNKGTKIKLTKDKEVEFRVNGSWHRIKLVKDEFFKI